MRIELQRPVHLPTLGAELGDERLSVHESGGGRTGLVWHDVPDDDAHRATLEAALASHVPPLPPPLPDPDARFAAALERALERPDVRAKIRAAIGGP